MKKFLLRFRAFLVQVPLWLGAFLALRCGSPEVPNPPPVPPPLPAQGESTVGIKNFRQLQYSLSYLTGISPSEPKVALAFENLKVKLSMDGNVEKISPALLLSITALSSAYCEAMIENELDKDSSLFADVDFNTTEPLKAETRATLVDNLTALFWQRKPTQVENEELLDLIQKVEKESPDTVTAVRDILLSLCTVIASSVESIQL